MSPLRALVALLLAACTPYPRPPRQPPPPGPPPPPWNPVHPEGFLDVPQGGRRPGGGRVTVEKDGIRIEVLDYERARRDRGCACTLRLTNDRAHPLLADLRLWTLAVSPDPAHVDLDVARRKPLPLPQEFMPDVETTPWPDETEEGTLRMEAPALESHVLPPGGSLTRRLSWNHRWSDGQAAEIRARSLTDIETRETFDLAIVLNDL